MLFNYYSRLIKCFTCGPKHAHSNCDCDDVTDDDGDDGDDGNDDDSNSELCLGAILMRIFGTK